MTEASRIRISLAAFLLKAKRSNSFGTTRQCVRRKIARVLSVNVFPLPARATTRVSP